VITVGLLQISGIQWTYERQRGPSFPGLAPMSPKLASFAFLPYAAGLLQAYVQQHSPDPSRYQFLSPLYLRTLAEPAAAHLAAADVVGFSTYCWNIELSLAIARRLHAERPDRLIVFGGPQVPDHAEEFLRAHPFIDLAVHGEGEAIFLNILESLTLDHVAAGWRPAAPMAGVSYLAADGSFVTGAKPPRIKDLSTVPSPYLTGVFDELMATAPNQHWHLLWETNRGCPFACTFCDWGSAVASKVYQFDMARLEAEIRWFSERRAEFLFVCDANFGLLPRDVDLAERLLAFNTRTGFPAMVGVQNTKNATERAYAVQTSLATLSPTGVTIALQSVDPVTLKAIKRDNISIDSFQELQRRYTQDGIDTYTDVILGLPGESYDSFANGAANVIANGQYNRLQFYNCYILPNAEMAAPAYRAQHGLKTVRTRMVNAHEPLGVRSEVLDEFLELVIETTAMPAADWVRTKIFAWWTDFLMADRLLQLPMVVLHHTGKLGYRTMIEAIAAADPNRFPIIGSIQALFAEKAREAQQGGLEYCPAPEWLNISWPTDQYALIQLATGWKTDPFYQEAEMVFGEMLDARDVSGGFHAPLHDAIELNRQMLRLPFDIDDLDIDLSYNIWEVVHSVVAGRPVALERRPSRYHIVRTSPVTLSWDEWLLALMLRFHKKSHFLYPLSVRPAAEISEPVLV
jgi:radical SAM superfamily enzyme YgiQ (UPF0313 family)